MSSCTVRGAPLALALLALAGCTTTGVAPASAPAAQTPATPPAAMLLEQAQSAANDGDYDLAAALVERAMRIDPRNAALYLELAELRLAQGQARQAENVALRAMSLAPGDRATANAAWDVVARARDRRGDSAGAAEARAAIGNGP